MAGSKVDMKIVLLGKSFAGKTSLVERYIYERFTGERIPYQNTIGAAFGAKKVLVHGKPLVLGIWDTAGSERYESMSRIYYRGAKAAILCYDLTDKSSFDRARFWIGELRSQEEGCKMYLCGTKKDLIEDEPSMRRVNIDAAKALASDCMADMYETSSKTGEHIESLFEKIAQDYIEATDPHTPTDEHESFTLRDIRKSSLCGCKES